MDDSLPRPPAEFPVTAKAVVLVGEAALLGRNDRDEWELLGGRPEAGEAIDATLVRELQEEAGVAVAVGARLLDEVFEVLPGRIVRVVAHRCALVGPAEFRRSDEHTAVALVPLETLDSVRLPDVYRRAIAAAQD